MNSIFIYPFLSIKNPNHSLDFLENLHFDNFNEKPSYNNRFKTSSTILFCSTIEPVETIKITSRKQNVLARFKRVWSIAFWDSMGMSVSP